MSDDRERAALWLAGGLVGLIGTGHIFMPTWGYPSTVVAELSPRVKDHFFYLGTYAICAFLLGMSATAFAMARAAGSRATRSFSIVMTVVWTARLVLELVFPVEIPIFILQRPHPVLVPVIGTIAVAFGVAALASRAALRERA